MTATIPKVLVIIEDNYTMQYEYNSSKATMLYYYLIISLGLDACSALNTKAVTLQ